MRDKDWYLFDNGECERLPDSNVDVLFHFRYDGQYNEETLLGYYDPDGDLWLYEAGGLRRVKQIPVAWQYLPDPPRQKNFMFSYQLSTPSLNYAPCIVCLPDSDAEWEKDYDAMEVEGLTEEIARHCDDAHEISDENELYLTIGIVSMPDRTQRRPLGMCRCIRDDSTPHGFEAYYVP